MKQIIKNRKTNISKFGILILLISFGFITSCEENLPDTGDIADLTPPNAGFSATQGTGVLGDEWKTYSFTNESSSATSYSWDFGNGDTSVEVEPSTTFPGEGTFTVTLTAKDNLGVASTYSAIIEVVEPVVPIIIVPDILESGFDNGNNSRDPWRNSDLGGVIQITSNPVQSGSNAAKFPSAGDRIAYQELEVSPNADYTLTYYYTIKTSPVGSVTVAVLAGGDFTDVATIPDATLASKKGEDQSSASDFVKVDLVFNSGNNSKVSIYVSNQGAEARVDSFSIVAN